MRLYIERNNNAIGILVKVCGELDMEKLLTKILEIYQTSGSYSDSGCGNNCDPSEAPTYDGMALLDKATIFDSVYARSSDDCLLIYAK